jgi:hypothetical protein
MTTILKDGTRLPPGNKSFHYFLEHIESGERSGKYLTYDRACEELDRIKNQSDYKIVGDWITVRG